MSSPRVRLRFPYFPSFRISIPSPSFRCTRIWCVFPVYKRHFMNRTGPFLERREYPVIATSPFDLTCEGKEDVVSGEIRVSTQRYSGPVTWSVYRELHTDAQTRTMCERIMPAVGRRRCENERSYPAAMYVFAMWREANAVPSALAVSRSFATRRTPVVSYDKGREGGRPDPDDARDRRDRTERASAEESRCSTARLGTARGKRGESNYLAAQVRRLVQHDEVGIVVENPLRQVEDRRRRQVDGSNTPILLNLFEAIGKVDGALPSEMVSGTKTDSRTHSLVSLFPLCTLRFHHFFHVDLLLAQLPLNQRKRYLSLTIIDQNYPRVFIADELIHTRSDVLLANLKVDASKESVEIGTASQRART